jgi:hypothetical protein
MGVRILCVFVCVCVCVSCVGGILMPSVVARCVARAQRERRARRRARRRRARALPHATHEVQQRDCERLRFSVRFNSPRAAAAVARRCGHARGACVRRCLRAGDVDAAFAPLAASAGSLPALMPATRRSYNLVAMGALKAGVCVRLLAVGGPAVTVAAGTGACRAAGDGDHSYGRAPRATHGHGRGLLFYRDEVRCARAGRARPIIVGTCGGGAAGASCAGRPWPSTTRVRL